MASPCHVPPTASRTVPLGRTGAWLNTPTRALRPRRTTPSSGSCSPLMMRNNVLLPQPFRPTTPTRSPSLRVIETSANNGRLGREALSPWASITITTAQATSTSPPQRGRWSVTRPQGYFLAQESHFFEKFGSPKRLIRLLNSGQSEFVRRNLCHIVGRKGPHMAVLALIHFAPDMGNRTV